MSKQIYCKACGHVGKAKNQTTGSILIELVLWCFLIVPGLFYSLWRMCSTKKVCPLCRSSEIIPIDSPLARQMLTNKGVAI